MSYTSYVYLVLFLSSTFICYNLVPKKIKWLVLLLASLAFYLVSSRKMIVYIIATTVSIYLAGLLIQRFNDYFDKVKKDLSKDEKKSLKAKIAKRKKRVIVLTLLFNFGILFCLKYINFFGGNFNTILTFFNPNLYIPTQRIILPLGISFYTLQASSYIIDVYRGKYKADRNLGRVALFLCYFPQIVEGPIGRYDLLADQLYEGHPFNYENFTFGLQLIVWGLFKKIVIADRANVLVNSVFGNHDKYSGLTVVAAILLYTLQLYAEFSGAMDIVSGSSQMFGISLSKNFKRPFFATSINDFWRRWHITLGAWLRDYIFYSVSLSKPFLNLSKNAKKHFNEHFGKLVPAASALFFVWIGNGIWHGADWKYICYGMYYYVLMIIGMFCEPIFSKILSVLHIKREFNWYHVFQIIRTFVIVNIGMLMFRADNLVVFYKMFKSIFANFTFGTLADGSLLNLGLDKFDFGLLIFGTIAIFVVGLLQEKGYSLRRTIADKNIVIRWCVYFAAIFLVIILGAYGTGYNAADFIYAQF